jgi:hypothetical protein
MTPIYHKETQETNSRPLHHTILATEAEDEPAFYIGDGDQAKGKEMSGDGWRNDVEHDLNHDHELDNIGMKQEEESRRSACTSVDVRAVSPTTTMVDISKDSHQKEESSTASSSSPLRRSVSWKENIVADVKYRPKTESREKQVLFYNSADMHRFRQHYKMQVRAAQEYQKRLRKESSVDASKPKTNSKKSKQQQQQQQSYTSPISGVINMFTSYLAKPTSKSSPNTPNSSVAMSRGPIAETCVLVDTLYLF